MKKMIFLAILLYSFTAMAQTKPNVVTVKGEAVVEWEQQRESKKQAQNRAEELAKVNALEKAFGVAIIQGNSTYVQNKTTGQKTETNTVFNMIGNTMVKGEVIEVLKKDFTDFYDKKKKSEKWEIKCEVEVRAKELTEAAVAFDASPLSGNKKNNKTSEFNENDELFFYFKSPVSGFLSIYVDVTGSNQTQRILPYINVPKDFENGMPVEADKEYIFFSTAKEHDYYPGKNVVVDELTVSAEQEKQEMWRIFIVFSTNPMNKPSLKNPKLQDKNKKIVEAPKELTSEEFQRWKINQQSLRNDIQIKTIDITVSKK
jgi:hypothetical protein